MTSASAITRFVVFSVARSGTSFLTGSLRSHPQILCHGEALLPRHFERHIHGSAREKLSEELCRTDPHEFVDRLYEFNDGFPIVGFKVFPAHSPTTHISLLEDRSIHKIVLRRENALASFSSLQIARTTGRWNTGRPDARPVSPVPFDRVDFEKYCSRLDRFFAKIKRRAQGPVLNVTYKEDIMTNRIKPILKFLGADSTINTSTKKSKMLTPSIVERFNDPAMVAEYLKEIKRSDWCSE